MALTTQEYIQGGIRRRAIPLVQQTRTTVLLAESDGPALAELLPTADHLETIKVLATQVETAMGTRIIAQADAKGATDDQDEQMRKGKLWVRRSRARAKRAANQGGKLPQKLLKPPAARSVPLMIDLLQDMTTLQEKNKTALKLAGGNIETLIAEGKTIHKDLSTYDAIQEAAWINSVPQAVRDFWEAKGKLYYALKSINDAAKELYADDSKKAAQYNMEILYRKG